MSKLEAIAELLSRVFFEKAEIQSHDKIIQCKETTISLCVHNHQHFVEPNSHLLINKTKGKVFDHALCLHLPIEPSEFCVRSEQGTGSLNAGPEAMVVTVGKQLEVNNVLDFIVSSSFSKILNILVICLVKG